MSMARRLDAQQDAVIFGRQDVEQSVRTLADVAHALPKIVEHRLAPELLPFVAEDNSLNLSGAWNAALSQTGDEQIVLPVREPIAGVERHAGQTDGGEPDDGRILQAF